MQGIDDKKAVLIEYCRKNNINLRHVAYVGNDINDLKVMGLVGWTFCPADAHEEICNISNYVLRVKGRDPAYPGIIGSQ